MSGTGDRLGVWLYDDLGLVREAERLGYDTIWASEGQGKTAFGKLERWATVVDDVPLGTGIVNVYSRSPAAIAQAVATLNEHADGGAMLGLGVAHPGVVEDFHGVGFERPLARMAEYITLVRRYVERVPEPYDGEFFAPERTSFWEGFDGPADLPIYNAAIGEENIRLTGEYADGWLPNIYPLDRLPEALDWLAEGAERVGRDLDDIDVAMYLPAAVAPDVEEARRAAARHVVRYWWGEIPGFYDRVIRDAGYEDVIRAIQAAPSPDAAAGEVPEGLLEKVAIWGTHEDVRARLDAYRNAGLDHPIVRPVGDPDVIERTLTTLAP